jgi:molecular chaperone DnaK
MGDIVGIDLGTSTSEIAVFEFGRPVIVRNRTGLAITPSAIFQQPNGELVVGEEAYKNAGAIREFKRKMDTDEKLRVGNRELLPLECSALLLRYLLSSYQEYRQRDADRAVITVPANWKDAPRRATKEAGRLAGVKVERLINEPTAAAMAFGSRPDAEGKTIAVYDLGGGTFDVTILHIQNRIFDVVTSVGDDRLGGSDIDAILVSHVIRQIETTEGYAHILGQNPQADHVLKLACEQAKKELSATDETAVRVPFWNPSGDPGRMVQVHVPITRDKFEDLIQGVVQRSLNHLDEALRRAKLPSEGIDEIVMVGGSTRIPLVRRLVAERMKKEPNTSDVNPDEAVALGAAIQAGIFDQKVVTEKEFFPLDIANNDLGVETMTFVNGQPIYGVFSTIIPKDTKLPARKTESYSTTSDGQRSIVVNCYQGKSKWTRQNQLIGEPLTVEDLPPKPKGEVKISITFGLDASEMLDVRVDVDDTGIAVERQFQIDGVRYSDDQHTQRRAELDSLWQRSELAAKHRKLIEQAEAKLQTPITGATAESLRTNLDALKKALVEEDGAAAERADVALSGILSDPD